MGEQVKGGAFRVHSVGRYGGPVLRIRYLGASGSTGARYSVSELGAVGLSARGTRQVLVPFRYELNGDERRADAVRAWADRFALGNRSEWLISGETKSGEWVAVCVPDGARVTW